MFSAILQFPLLNPMRHRRPLHYNARQYNYLIPFLFFCGVFYRKSTYHLHSFLLISEIQCRHRSSKHNHRANSSLFISKSFI